VRAAFHLGFLPLDRVSRLVDPHRLLLSVAVVPRHNLRHLLEKDGVLVGDFVDASCEEKRVRFRSVVVLLSEESASPPALWLPVQRWVHTLLVEYFLGSCFEVRVDVWGAVIHGTRVVRVRARRHVGQRLVVRSQMHLDGLLVAGILHPDDPGQLSAVPTHSCIRELCLGRVRLSQWCRQSNLLTLVVRSVSSGSMAAFWCGASCRCRRTDAVSPPLCTHLLLHNSDSDELKRPDPRVTGTHHVV
jgi:hypothetical protein